MGRGELPGQDFVNVSQTPTALDSCDRGHNHAYYVFVDKACWSPVDHCARVVAKMVHRCRISLGGVDFHTSDELSHKSGLTKPFVPNEMLPKEARSQ